MNSIWINAPAKINIGLDVLRRREDGYHEVKMIMQSIRLFDRLTLTKSDKPGIRLTTNLRFLPVNEDNLVYRSASIQDAASVLPPAIPAATGIRLSNWISSPPSSLYSSINSLALR